MSGAGVRIDAHQHFWRLARGDYAWLTPDLRPLFRDFGPSDLLPELESCEVDATVVVQAADTVAESQFLLEVAEQASFVAGVVGWVDMQSHAAAQTIAKLAEDEKLVGIRPMIQDIPDERWMLRPELEPALRALVELDLAFDALVKPQHLAHLRTLLARHPDLRVVIDHGAKPVIPARGESWSGFVAWRDHMAALAAGAHTCCKLSGLVTQARPQWAVDDLRLFTDVLFEHFGAYRLLWGSDWPVVELGGGYRAWWRATQELLQPLSREEADAVLGGNAQRFYQLAVPVARSSRPQGRARPSK